MDRMPRGKMVFFGIALITAMVVAARQAVHRLVQRAAQGNVQLLNTPAYRQDRQAGPRRRTQKRQGRRITIRIVLFGRQAVVVAVERRMDIRFAARHQQPIDAVKQRNLCGA